MAVISDYASVLEIGFGLNVATSYVSAFINPVLSRSRSELYRFKWWVENPDRAKVVLAEDATPDACEDRLVSWEQAYDNLERHVSKISQIPVGVCISAALGTIILLLVPEMSVSGFGVLGMCAIAFAPTVGGAIFVLESSGELRKKVQIQARRANKLFK